MRILGTETEYGIGAKDPEAIDPVSNSILLVNSFPYLPSSGVLWDYENENPLLDARGFEAEGERERPGPEYNRLLNKLLQNGGRLYVDGAHPEYSTPECTNAHDLVVFERAGERILEVCREAANRMKRDSERFVVYKNNSDGKGNSYGYHENYLVSREIPFDRLVTLLVPFFVTRQIFAGAGKVGAENKTEPVPYQLSQRADFFEVLVDLNTMVKRPIINTRDEPHADPTRWRRLHVIVGDANMSELSTYLKVGTTALLLALIEEDADRVPVFEMENPVRAIKEISRDLELKKTVRLTDGRALTPIEIQGAYLEAVEKGIGPGADPVTRDLLARWRTVLETLAQDPMLLSRELDWVIKRQMIEAYRERRRCGWEDPRVAMMDLQYHDLRPDKGLYFALERRNMVKRVVTDAEIERAIDHPPLDTRAYFRGQCLSKFPKEVYAASWSSVLFDVGNSTVKKVSLQDPLRGSEPLVGLLLSQARSAEELLSLIRA